MKQIISDIINFVKKRRAATAFLVILVLSLGIFVFKNFPKAKQPEYQTTQVEKGTLIISVTASGQVSEANSATVGTKASGVVKQIYVTNGQKVQAGDKIAEIDLDLEGQQRATSAWASYQSTKDSLYSLQSDMLSKWKTFKDLAESGTYQNADNTPRYDMRTLSQYVTVEDDWLATEAKYKNQQNLINSAWLSYQQTSPTVYAPISGTVTGLALQVGTVLTAQSNTSGTSTAQKIASIQTDASPIIQVDLTQIDTPKVKIGNKATLTFDAFPNKTFTGKVVSIDTIGSVSSGVTTYPAVIKLDTQVPEIFSNMTTSATIITQIKDNVFLVPTSAVQTQNEQSTVRVLKNNKINQVTVETGLSSSTQVEITSGLSEGDTVITSVISSSQNGQTGSSQTQSPFSGIGGGGAFRMGQ